MAYGSVLTDVVQSSTSGTPPQFNDGGGTQIGTLCRAWVSFVGGTTPTVKGSFNVSSVTFTSTGIWSVTLTNAMPDTNYCAQVSNQQNSTANSSSNLVQPTSTSVITVLHYEAATNANTFASTNMFVAVFR